MIPPAFALGDASTITYAQKYWTRNDYRMAARLWDALVSNGARRTEETGQTPPSLQEFLAEAYGNRFVLFLGADSAASAAAAVVVMESMPIGCLGGTAMESSIDTVLPLLGPAETLSVTPNGQFLFASMGRSEWQLRSMERSVAICAQLAQDPSDPFLAQYASSCAPSDPALVPRLPVVSDFLQVASACLPGMYCPSFNDEVIQELPAGQYSNFQFDVSPCTPGHVCVNGQQQACPTGFQCPDFGMSLPVPCLFDGTLSTTCFYSGSIRPVICPNGTLCGSPYMPPLPAPPGYAQGIYNASAASGGTRGTVDGTSGYQQGRSLTRCASGEWCSLGRAVSEGPALLACPAGAACSDPALLEPVICNLGGNCSATSCPKIPYCPAGSTAELLCPAGSFCSNTTTASACSPGSFCPEGSPLWQLCPAASFCPNASAALQCPRDAYCEQGSVSPIMCSPLSHCVCDGGCAQPPVAVAVQVTVIIIAAVLVLYLAWRFWGRTRWVAYAKVRKARRRKEQLHPVATLEDGDAAGGNRGLAQPLLAEESGVPGTSVRFNIPGDELLVARGTSINAGVASRQVSMSDRAVSSASLGSAITADTPSEPRGYRSSMRWGAGGVRAALAASALTEDPATMRKRFTLSVRFDGLSLTLKGGSKAKVREESRPPASYRAPTSPAVAAAPFV